MPNKAKSTSVTVREAFEAARQGDLAPSSNLQHLGRRVVPHLGPYLRDKSEDVRRQVVALLKAAGGRTALPLLLKALSDPSMEIQERAAEALYEVYSPAVVHSQTTAAAALRKTVRGGNRAPGAALLVAYFPGRASIAALETLAQRDPEATAKLRPWFPPVPVHVSTSVALSRLGNQPARQRLLGAAEAGELGTMQFLLSVLREIDAPEVLHSLAKALDDTREVNLGVPSGVRSRPRVCDLAVNRFVERLKLKVRFERSDAVQYTPGQIEEVRQAIAAAIPKAG